MGGLGDRTPHTLVSVRLSQEAAGICFLHPQSFKGKTKKSKDEYAAHHQTSACCLPGACSALGGSPLPDRVAGSQLCYVFVSEQPDFSSD